MIAECFNLVKQAVGPGTEQLQSDDFLLLSAHNKRAGKLCRHGACTEHRQTLNPETSRLCYENE